LNYATSNTTVGIGAPFLYNFARGNGDIRKEGSLSTIQPDKPAAPNLLSLITQKLIFYNPSLNLVQPAEGFKNPYALHYTLAIDRQLKNDYWVTLSYVGTSARKLLRVWNPGWGQSRNGVRFEGILSRGQFPLFWADLTQYKTLSSITSNVFVNRLLFEGTANSSYNSLQAELKRRYRGGLQFGWAFTYSHAIDDASDFFDTSGAFALPQNSRRRSERGSSSFDSRVRSATLFVWDLPWRKNHKLLGGWQLNGIHTAQTGQPFTVNTAIDWNTDGNLTDRLNNTVGLRTGPVDGDRRIRLAVAPGFDPSLLLPPNTRAEELANYRDGAVGRNTFRSSGIGNLDLAVVKGFALREDWTLRFRCEFFNILNRSHFGIPVRILEAPGFGESVTTTVPERTLQFALKLSF
jgi:hypothetical protein